MAGANTYEYASGAGTHQVKRSFVTRTTANDGRDWQLADYLLEIECFVVLRLVFGGHHSALDDKDVELCLEDFVEIHGGSLWRERGSGHNTG